MFRRPVRGDQMKDWFNRRTFHHEDFCDLARLVASKKEQGLTVSVGLPTLNVAKTVGGIVKAIKKTLVEEYPLVDQIAIIDSRSSDATVTIAERAGAEVYFDDAILPSAGHESGKGEALWKSLAVLRGDIVLWIDSDIKNIDPHFVYGLIGPLLLNPEIGFAKGFYRRPRDFDSFLQADEGGRVTKLMARPLLNLYYPELTNFIQPLAGEYGGRREILESVPFFTGYAVEIGLLIEICKKYGLKSMAQVNLEERVHRHHGLNYLSKMSFAILQGVSQLLREEGRLGEDASMNSSFVSPRFKNGEFKLLREQVKVIKRAPINTYAEYHDRISEQFFYEQEEN